MSETAEFKPARYHGAAIALHWGIALLLVYQFALGLRLEEKAAPADTFTAFQQHKSIGIAILVLSLARLALRMVKPRPAEIGSNVERTAARLAHWAFYAIMILGPISGWIIASTAKIKVPTVLFGLIPLPHLPVPRATHEPAELAHEVLGWALPVLLALHVAAVVYHMRKADPVAQRMLPVSAPAKTGLLGALAALALAGWLGAAGPIPNLWTSLTAPAKAPDTSDVVLLPSDITTESPVETDEPAVAASEEPLASEAAVSCDWTVTGGRLGFTATYAGEPVNGSFRNWDAKIVFCEDNPAAASIAANVSLASADTADSTRDENLKGASFFDAGSFPKARFAARGFTPAGPGRYTANGTLSLRGKSRPVRLTFSLKVNGDKASAQGSTRLSRLAFGVGTDEWAATDQIADAVAVNFTIQAKRK
jgi:cytochrome b561/polyisoprenoid-binding protein YceI